MNKHTILAVNDAPDQLELLAFLLGEANYRVVRAENGVEGLEIARRESPDLIISDVTMPEMNGVEFCRRIRADEKLRSIPFLLISALCKETENAVEGFEAGADDYIEVPYEPMRLIAKVAQLVERGKAAIALRESEERYRNFIGQSTEGIWRIEFKAPIPIDIPVDKMIELFSRHSFYAECNDAMARMYGFASAGDLTGKSCGELLNFSESENREFMRSFIENGFRLNDGESHEIDRDGRDKYFLNNFVGIVEGGNLAGVWGIQRDITANKLAEQVLQASQARLEKQNAVLNELTKRRKLFHVPVNTAIREITEISARVLETERVGVWLYDNDKSKIKALDVYYLGSNDHSEDAELSQSDYPAYFEALVNDESIVCDEVQIDARTREFAESYLKPLGITSMLDVPIRSGGHVVGVVCHEHVGAAREWKLDELNFAASMAGLISLLLEANERRQAENALRASQEHLALAQKTGKIGSFELDLKTGIAVASTEMKLLYGIPSLSAESRLEIWDEDWIKYVRADDVPKVEENLARVLENGVLDMEYRIVRSDGATRWVSANGKVFYDDEGAPARVVGVNTDVTERKEAELTLRFQKSLLEAQNEASLDGILVIAPDGKVLSCNRRYVEMWEIPEDVLAAKSDEKLLAAVLNKLLDPQAFLEHVEYLYQNPFVKDQVEINLKDNRTFERYSAPVGDSDTAPLGRIWYFRDITKRRQMERERAALTAELDSEKARLQHIFDNSPSFVVSMRGPDFVFEMVNPAYYRLIGQRDLIGIPARDALPELADQGLPELLTQVYETGESFIGDEVPVKILLPNGGALEQRYINFVYMPMREADDSISGIISYGMDVTEQVLSRIKIRESEERYRLLFDSNPLPMWVYDIETFGFLAVNDAAILHYGYSREEFLSMTIKDIRPREDIPVLLKRVSQTNGEIESASFWRHIKKNGDVIDVEITSNELPFAGKRAELVMAVDITERKKTEESIRFQAHLLDTVEQAVIATDLDGSVVYWNRFAEKLYGWTAAEAVGRRIRELTTPATSAEQAGKIMAQLQAGESWTGEFTVRNKTGATFPAHVSNSPVTDKKGNLVGVVGVSVDISERKKAEEALLQAEAKYRNLVESSPGIVYLNEPYPPYSNRYISPNIKRYGYSPEEWRDEPGMWSSIIIEEDRERVIGEFEAAVKDRLETELEYRILDSDGTIHWWQDKGRFITDEQGNEISWQGVILDVTETKRLEEQLRLSQKLESVGRMAGGIAHDFNNMLTAINGYSDLTLRRLEPSDPLRGNIEEIKKAGERSAALTQQLLAFSRRQVLKPKIINFNEIVLDTSKMLRRLIGEDIHLSIVPFSELGLVEADPGQLTQVIMNLAINARDAMPSGGSLIIETSNVRLDEEYAKNHVPTQPGSYVLLSVSDCGVGMTEKIKQHIFEPFYTTKETGKGTGLGLATVYGIIKQSGGYIWVDSEEGVGTKFNIYLPRVDAETMPAAEEKAAAIIERGTETILLVEDEDIVRKMSRQMLELCGYNIIEARNGVEALSICESENPKIDLLLTDVVMPQMGGRELAARLTEKYPHLRLLFTSGYTDDAIIRRGIITEDMNFIQKPFTFDALTKKIRELLNQE